MKFLKSAKLFNSLLNTFKNYPPSRSFSFSRKKSSFSFPSLLAVSKQRCEIFNARISTIIKISKLTLRSKIRAKQRQKGRSVISLWSVVRVQREQRSGAGGPPEIIQFDHAWKLLLVESINAYCLLPFTSCFVVFSSLREHTLVCVCVYVCV